MSTIKHTAVSFGSIKPSVRLGESVIKDYSKEFPGIISSTKLGVKYDQLNADNKPMQYSLIRLCNKYDNKIRVLRDKLTKEYFSTEYFSAEKFIKSLKKQIHNYKVANCGEQAYLTKYALEKKGKEARRIRIEIVGKKDKVGIPYKVKPRTCSDHAFVIIDHKKGADLNDIQKWGNKTVIVDTWSRFCGSVDDAMRRYKQEFNLDEKTEKFNFTEV